jgi:hypothetical protein
MHTIALPFEAWRAAAEAEVRRILALVVTEQGASVP